MYLNWSLFQFSSVAQLCLTLCDPMDTSTPGCPIPHHLNPDTWVDGLKLMSIESMMPSNHLTSIIPFSSCPQSFPASGSFQMSQLFTSGGQSIGVSASASVLPMNIQDWFPLGLTGWISLLSKGLSRVFSNTTVQKHQFSALSLLYTILLAGWYFGKCWHLACPSISFLYFCVATSLNH